MESINELQDLCNFAVLISTNDLMIDWIEFLKTQSNNKSMSETYDKMIVNLRRSYVEEFSDPYSIAEKEWGIGAGQQFLPIVDIHQTYYTTILGKINEYFVNKLLVLSTDESFQIKIKFIQNNLQVAFHIPKDVTYDKLSRSSTFHTLKGKYATWLNNRKSIEDPNKKNKILGTKDFLDYNFKELRKLVDEYS